MSAENVNIVKAAYAAFGSGDLAGLGAHFSEDAEWETTDSLPLGGVVRGREAILGNFSQIPNYWSAFTVQPDEYIDAGDHVLVRGVQQASGPGGSFQSRFLHLAEVRDGKIVRGEFFSDSAKARDALGS
jgi:uncharacterized protein